MSKYTDFEPPPMKPEIKPKTTVNLPTMVATAAKLAAGDITANHTAATGLKRKANITPAVIKLAQVLRA